MANSLRSILREDDNSSQAEREQLCPDLGRDGVFQSRLRLIGSGLSVIDAVVEATGIGVATAS
jgi:hypothetical protein